MGKKYRFAFKRLDVYQAAVQHFNWTCDVVQRLPRGPFKVIDQSVGASLSVMGNNGEAHGREAKPGEIEQHYRYAQGSTFESATHLDAFSALGVITDDEYNAEEERLARIGMMLTRLIQKQRRRRKQLGKIYRGQTDRARNWDSPQRVTSQAVSNPREARPGGRSPARFESRRVAEGAERPPAIESPRRGAPAAAPAAEEFEHREPEGTEA